MRASRSAGARPPRPSCAPGCGRSPRTATSSTTSRSTTPCSRTPTTGRGDAPAGRGAPTPSSPRSTRSTAAVASRGRSARSADRTAAGCRGGLRRCQRWRKYNHHRWHQRPAMCHQRPANCPPAVVSLRPAQIRIRIPGPRIPKEREISARARARLGWAWMSCTGGSSVNCCAQATRCPRRGATTSWRAASRPRTSRPRCSARRSTWACRRSAAACSATSRRRW